MKYMYAALLGLGLLSGTLMQAKVEDTKKAHVIKKKSVYKKTAKPKAKPAQVHAKKAQSHKIKSKPKKQVYKNVTKRAVNPASAKIARPTAATSTTEPIASAPKATDETAYQKLTNWLGFGAAGAGTTAAAKQVLVGHHKTAGYHTGPRKEKWNHPFESWWGKRGFEEGINANGHWVFGSYRPAWWQKNYPTYWKDVVGPLYRQSAEYKAAVAQIGK